MIVPVGINHVIRGWPRVTIALIVACTLVHVYGETLGPSYDEVKAQIEQRIDELPLDADEAAQAQAAYDIEHLTDLIPAIRFGYRTDQGLSYRALTSAFVHADWLHLLGNMLFLWLAGAALEDRWGRARFVGFYAAGAIVSALGFAMLHHGDAVNLVGASGAISALMGAFLVHFARTHIHFVYWLGLHSGRFDAVAYVALPAWLAEQLLLASLQSDNATSSIAFTAHIIGFAFGVAVALIAKVVAGSADARAAGTRDVPRTVSRPPARRSKPPPRQVAPIQPPPVAAAPSPPVEPPKREASKQVAPADPGSEPRFLT